MKKIIMPVSNNEMLRSAYEQGLDIAIVGLKGFSCRFENYYDIDQIDSVVAIAKQYKKEIFVSLNDFYFEEIQTDLENLVQHLCLCKVDGIIFHDLAVLAYAKKYDCETLLCYHPDTLNTHSEITSFWKQAGVNLIFIAKEIPLLEQLTIANQSELNTMMQVHGCAHLLHSKRQLVTNYTDFVNDKSHNSNTLFIHEKLSEKSSYVLEEATGTHIFTQQKLVAISEIDLIKQSAIKYLYIESIYTSYESITDTIKTYRNALDNDYSKEELINIEALYVERNSNIPFYKGYFYDQTVYTVDQARKRETNESKYFKSR